MLRQAGLPAGAGLTVCGRRRPRTPAWLPRAKWPLFTTAWAGTLESQQGLTQDQLCPFPSCPGGGGTPTPKWQKNGLSPFLRGVASPGQTESPWDPSTPTQEGTQGCSSQTQGPCPALGFLPETRAKGKCPRAPLPPPSSGGGVGEKERGHPS